MSARKTEKIAGWSIVGVGLIIALYGCGVELSAGIRGPNWGWLAAGIVLIFTGWLACMYGRFLIAGRSPRGRGRA
jgi:hypothetical protein